MNIPIYPGSSSFIPGATPFGFYDYDTQFQIDADKVTTFVARRLGYPIMKKQLLHMVMNSMRIKCETICCRWRVHLRAQI